MTEAYARRVRRRKRLLKCLWYGLMLLGSFLLLTDPHVTFFGCKPNLLVPLCVMLAVFEGEYVGAMVGAGAGLLMDMALGTLVGIHGVAMLLLMFLCGLAVRGLLRPVLPNCVFLTAVSALLLTLLHFSLRYWLPGYEGCLSVFLRVFLPNFVATTAFALVLFWPVRAVERRLRFEV